MTCDEARKLDLVDAPFSNGSEFMDWNNANCCACAKAGDDGMPKDCAFAEWAFIDIIPKDVADVWRESARRSFRDEMLDRGISTRSHYAAIWHHPAYEFLREQGERDCPLAAQASKEVVTLPLFSAMTDEECAAVCAALKDVLGG